MRILIADDHHLIVEGLTRILLDVFPFSEIESVANADLLYKKSILEKWDIIITDICMPGSSVIDTIKQLKLNTPQTPILVLTMYAAEHYAVRCIRAGASGFVTKESSPYELIAAIKQILSGKKYFTQNVAEILADWFGLRKKYKSMMKDAYKSGDKATGDLYNQKQHSIKILLNSVYGTFAINSWRFTDGHKMLSSSITTTGQRFITETIKYANEIVEEGYFS